MNRFRSLTHLFLAAAMIVGCGSSGGSPENNRKAAELVLSKGGELRVVDVGYPVDQLSQLPSGSLVVISIDLSEKKCSDDDLLLFSELKALEKLNLYGTQVTDSGLDAIARLKSLGELELSYTLVGDEGLQKLKDLKQLEKLFLYGTPVTDDGIKSFQLRSPDVKIYR